MRHSILAKKVQLDILTLSLSRYDWSSLDRRVNQMVKTENFSLLPPEHIVFIKVETGGTPVITLCCAPDWMKGGEPGFTNWSRLEVAGLSLNLRFFLMLVFDVCMCLH